MRRSALIAMTAVALTLGACTKEEDKSVGHEAGRAAAKIAAETEKAAKKAGKELKEFGREAREGWKEAKQEEKTKQRK